MTDTESGVAPGTAPNRPPPASSVEAAEHWRRCYPQIYALKLAWEAQRRAERYGPADETAGSKPATNAGGEQ